MEKSAETPLKELNQLKSSMNLEQQKTPPTLDDKIGLKTKLVSLSGGTPERLKVPKAFKHPERYMSPTDRMISPVSKGLILARRRRPGSLLPPSMNQPSKIKDLQSEDVEKVQQTMEEFQV
ncbi:hypothetical protein V2J09_006863 [Rumex salicifolius]